MQRHSTYGHVHGRYVVANHRQAHTSAASDSNTLGMVWSKHHPVSASVTG